ncbi:hypothetical protein [Bradyrhizobium sp. dw_411]|uniref:hypothetical protein n=1 Tax=Bradyrhizobium sp. dw_411 TaxID=2720082 RepID=UPI001BCF94CB|nr:hypothetical protein [Bradyrhizobium sp. dw_411]
MSDRLKVRFLTVIWGTRYIEEFAKVSLPSYLAAGNLPFMAAETDLEIVVMTSMESRDKFEERDYLDKLKAFCTVRYILIDDLITNGNYGVTLTLAYARGIRDSGPEQTNTHFVFMNSDFVLAEGSLKTLVAKLREGHRAIMAPSLRACSEAVVPVLIDAVDQASGTLTMSPRPMVQLAFDNLHPTVIGKTVTQDFVTCTNHNQIYWQVDRKTLLGRYHLIFMLAIKPEVPMGLVNSYCDYGLIPELVPSGDFSIIDDSDGFFMLELQSAEQEKGYLRCAYTSPEQIAAELSSWATREHRRFAEVDVVFRSGDLPAGLAQVRAEAARFMSELNRHMTPPPDHVDHFYWTSGVQAWASTKFPGVAPVLPPEIASEARLFAQPSSGVEAPPARDRSAEFRRSLLQLYTALIGFVRRNIGVIPDVPIWHYLWLDSRLILNWINSIAGHAGQKNALVCDDTSPLLLSLRKHMPIERHFGLEELVSGAAIPASGYDISDQAAGAGDGILADQKFDHILVHVRRTELPNLRKALEWAEKCIKPDGTIAVYIENRSAEDYEGNFSIELAQSVQNLLPVNWLGLRLNASFAGGRVKRRLRSRERFLFRFMWPSSAARLPLAMFAGLLWSAVAALTTVNNFRLRNRSSECLDYCSSALLCLNGLPEGGAMTASPSEARRTAA